MPAVSIRLPTTVFLRELQGASEELSRWENKASPIRHHLQVDTQHKYLWLLAGQKRPSYLPGSSLIQLFYTGCSVCSELPRRKSALGLLGSCASPKSLKCSTENCAEVEVAMQAAFNLEIR